MKRILIETGHPGQIHQFRHLCLKLTEAGYRVMIVAKQKDISRQLLEAFHLDHQLIGRPGGAGIVRKILRLPALYLQYFRILRRFRPDIMISRFSLQSAHLGWLLRIPHIGYTDTEHVQKLDAFTVPFVKTRITSVFYGRSLGKNHYRFLGNTELFYLHPNHFSPDPSVLKMLGVEPEEPYAILRFVSWNAHHDVGLKGISEPMKVQIVKQLEKMMRVFVSSEEPLSPTLAPNGFKVPPERMHDALAFASLYLGEGMTMASEAALLGTPSVYVNPLMCGYLQDEADAGLVVTLPDESGLPETLEEMLAIKDAKAKALLLRNEYLADKCDPTAFLFWLVTNYPDSLNALQANPALALQFKS